jgi:hypothetical protein
MEVNWTEFKKFVDARGCSIQFVEVNKNYWMKAFSGKFEVECFLPLDPANEETAVFLASYLTSANKQTVEQIQPFLSKILPTGKKIYRRAHGLAFTLNDSATNSGITIVEFTVPYAQCKITEAKILWAPEGIFANFEIYDTAAGTYSTIPNYKLNQFGFNIGITKDFFSDKSDYDADLYYGMIIRATFTNNTNVTKPMCIDLVLHEVK